MEAAALAKTNNEFVDKIILFVNHGEIAENEDETVGNVNASLTGKVRINLVNFNSFNKCCLERI